MTCRNRLSFKLGMNEELKEETGYKVLKGVYSMRERSLKAV